MYRCLNVSTSTCRSSPPWIYNTYHQIFSSLGISNLLSRELTRVVDLSSGYRASQQNYRSSPLRRDHDGYALRVTMGAIINIFSKATKISDKTSALCSCSGWLTHCFRLTLTVLNVVFTFNVIRLSHSLPMRVCWA